MLPRQVVELSKGAYEIVEELGHGASSRVYLVQRCSKPLFQIPTQTTNPKAPDNTPQQMPQTNNPDLAKLDQLVIDVKKVKQESQVDLSVVCDSHSSFLIENGRQNISPVPNAEEAQSQKAGEFFALKTVIIESDNAEQKKKEKQYWREVEMLGILRHPGIVRALDQGSTSRDGKRELHLVTELGKGGNFLRFLDTVAEAGLASRDIEAVYKHSIVQIVDIVDYLQCMGVSHRDLKAENFIMDERYCLKLIDFGAAEQFSIQVQDQEERGYVGTKHYISPEMIERSRHSCSREHYSKSDVWSLGVLMYFIFTRRYPFVGPNTFCILDSIKNREPDLSHLQDMNLRLLLASMLKKNPADRIGIHEIKMNPYFSDVNFGAAFTMESPFARLLRQQSEEVMFREELVVRINGQAKRRVVSLTRKQFQRLPRQEPILDRMSSLANIDIKKNASQQTELQSENRIESSVSLDLPIPQKFYLTIGKMGSSSQPKFLEILHSTTIWATKGVCRLEWKDKDNTIYEDCPQSVELKFESEECLDHFVNSFQTIIETLS